MWPTPEGHSLQGLQLEIRTQIDQSAGCGMLVSFDELGITRCWRPLAYMAQSSSDRQHDCTTGEP